VNFQLITTRVLKETTVGTVVPGTLPTRLQTRDENLIPEFLLNF